MKLVHGFERLELHIGARVIDLLPARALRRAFGYVVPVVRPWPFRIRWTGIFMTLDLLLHARGSREVERGVAHAKPARGRYRPLADRHGS